MLFRSHKPGTKSNLKEMQVLVKNHPHPRSSGVPAAAPSSRLPCDVTLSPGQRGHVSNPPTANIRVTFLPAGVNPAKDSRKITQSCLMHKEEVKQDPDQSPLLNSFCPIQMGAKIFHLKGIFLSIVSDAPLRWAKESSCPSLQRSILLVVLPKIKWVTGKKYRPWFQ